MPWHSNAPSETTHRSLGRPLRIGAIVVVAMKNQLPRKSFLALAAIGWADGSLQRVEAAGLIRAAKESGLVGDDLVAIEEAAKTRSGLEGIDLSGMSRWEQVLTY